MDSSETKSRQARTRIFVVEDHPLVREGLTLLIGNDPKLTVCGTADATGSALAGIQETAPHVVLVDVSLGKEDGLELVRKLHRQKPELMILVISMHDEENYAERALRAGAKGYIMKSEALDTVRAAIHRILSGEIAVSEKMVGHMLNKLVKLRVPEEHSLVDSLTDREFEVFRMIGQGAGPAEIAQKLNLSVKTVDTHRDHIKAKLELKSGAELRVYASKWHGSGR